MEKDKIKAYLLFAGVGAIAVTVVASVLYTHFQEELLYAYGVKTGALVKHRDRSRNFRTRTFYYSLILSYADTKGKPYTRELTVEREEYGNASVGDTVEILMDPFNPSAIALVDRSRYYGTEERVVAHEDLKDFLIHQNPAGILNKLNTISVGWHPDENDTSCFMNSARGSFMRLAKDSITYYGPIAHEEALTKGIAGLRQIESGQYDQVT